MRRSIALFALVLALLACHRPPAPARELRLIETALQATTPTAYEAAATQLESHRKEGLAALREQSAPEGTREELLLAALKERLRNPQRGETTLYWAERLLVRNDPVAAEELAQRRGKIAAQTLEIAARTPREPAGAALRSAAKSLSDHGNGEALLAAMKAWESAPLAESTRRTAARFLREGLRNLQPSERESIEEAALRSLERDRLTNRQRAALLGAIAEIGRSTAMERVAKLRVEAPWARNLRAELDEVLQALLAREEQRGSAT